MASSSQPQPVPIDNGDISRSDFPAGFIFGAGTAAYQVEGASLQGGKSLNIWDDMCFNTPSAIYDGSSGVVSCDMYHRYKEDIANMKKLGFDSYRFSIAWARILPGGRLSAGGVNREAVNYYNGLIDTIIANGLIPMATVFHFDLPSSLQNEYGGFLSKKIVDDFTEYAGVCFWEFGDRVKFWTTINEPWTYCVNGYVNGNFPPREAATTPEKVGTNVAPHRVPQHHEKCMPKMNKKHSDVKFDKSDPAKDVYTVARNMLLAHSAAVQLYRTKYQAFQEGKIGIVLNSQSYVPFDENSEADKTATLRAFDFGLGWFLAPLLYGHYPQTMIDYVPPENLRHFSKHESHMLKGSLDFLGLNYYTTYYVKDAPHLEGIGYDADQKLTFEYSKKGKLIGEQSASTWQYIVPYGIYGLLMHTKNTYNDLPPIYITENGVSQKDDPTLTITQATADPIRIKFYQDHLFYLLKAIKEKVDVRGYYIWAYCDNFEWADGYSRRFGIMYVDYRNNLARYPKHSALWFAAFLKGKKKMIALAHERVRDEENDLAANSKED